MSEKNSLHVFSGKCDLGEIGIDIDEKDHGGGPLHVGDIVMISYGNYIGTDIETWNCSSPLTAIVVDQETGKPFVMGIKGCGFRDPEWRITIVKKFSDVVAGEHWPAWGFNYREAQS